MSRTRNLLAGCLLALSAAAGLAIPAAASASSSPAPALKLATVKVMVNGKSEKQTLIVNSAGHAVYLLTGDSAKKPKCTSSTCLDNWPAVTTSSKKPVLGKGIKGKLAIWHHKGLNQLTLNGHPLYLFAADTSAGIAGGQGLVSFGGTWEVLSASGAAAKLSDPSSSSGSGSGW